MIGVDNVVSRTKQPFLCWFSGFCFIGRPGMKTLIFKLVKSWISLAKTSLWIRLNVWICLSCNCLVLGWWDAASWSDFCSWLLIDASCNCLILRCLESDAASFCWMNVAELRMVGCCFLIRFLLLVADFCILRTDFEWLHPSAADDCFTMHHVLTF